MKRYERGQGLVEYALVLVLVAIVAIAILALIGPQIEAIFCDIAFVLDNPVEPGDFDSTHVVSMDLSEPSVTFDVRYTDYEEYFLCKEIFVVDDMGEPSHGHAVHLEYSTFTYSPNDPSSGTDDSFTFSWHHRGLDEPNDIHTSLVTIIVGVPDLAMSQSKFLSSAMNTTQEENPEPELKDVHEDIFALFEAAEEQEVNFQEGVDLAVEAVEEGLEVLIEFADDTANSLLSDSLFQLLEEVEDGNLDAVPEVIAQIGTDLAEAPIEVWLDMSLRMAPRLIKSCVVVSEGSVSPVTIDGAVLAVQGLDEDHPGKAKALQLLQIAVAAIEERNNAAQEYTDIQSTLLEIFVAGFELAGEEDLAEQLADDSEACGN